MRIETCEGEDKEKPRQEGERKDKIHRVGEVGRKGVEGAERESRSSFTALDKEVLGCLGHLRVI